MYLQILITGSKTNNNNHKRQPKKKFRAIFFKGNLISNFDIGLVILIYKH